MRERECGSLRVFSLLITKEHNNPLLYQLLYTKLLLSTQYTNILLSTQSTCDPSGVTDQTSDSWLKDLMLGSRDERPTSASTPARAAAAAAAGPEVAGSEEAGSAAAAATGWMGATVARAAGATRP